jgi:hypothetical protein
MYRTISLLAIVFAFTPLNLAAQYVGTYLVIPQVADATLSNGTAYQTMFVIDRAQLCNSQISCTLNLVVMSASRLPSPNVTLSTSSYRCVTTKTEPDHITPRRSEYDC